MMKKLLLVAIASGICIQLSAQGVRQNKKNYDSPDPLNRTNTPVLVKPTKKVNSPAPSSITLNPIDIGEAGNMFTALGHTRRRVDANQALNAVAFTHRLSENGGSGLNMAGFDLSLDGGMTWAINQGPVIPVMPAEPHVRYPQGIIYNPAGNSNPNNASMIIMGARALGTNPNVSGWGGLVYGDSRLDASNSNYSTAFNSTNAGIPQSLCNGKNGEFWTIDQYDTAQHTLLYKGVWNASGDSVQWSIFQDFDFPWDVTFDGTDWFAGINIAFDPSGKFGWIGILGDFEDDNVSEHVYIPIFYSSSDSGATWSGPQFVDLRTFSNVQDSLDGGGSLVPMPGFDFDLGVDGNGNPHLISVVSSGSDYTMENITTHIYDITKDENGWKTVYMDSVSAFRGVVTSDVNQDNQVQVTVSADGSKVFATWLDTNPANQPNPGDNDFPDLIVKGYDVVTKKLSPTINTTAGSSYDGLAYLPSASKIALVDGSVNKVPVVILEHDGNSGNPVNFIYLEGINIDNSEFTEDANQSYSTGIATLTNDAFSVSNNYPNPFSGTTNINVTLHKPADVTLTVYNTLGQVITEQVAKKLGFGTHTFTVDGSNLNAGVYMYTVTAAGMTETGRMMVK